MEEVWSMAHKTKHRPDLKAVPMLLNESLYIGIDVGKQQHVAGFVSTTLLERHERFEGCPVLVFEQSREGFRALVERIRSYIALEQAYVLLEHTGHYHLALVQYLQELDISVYVMPVQKRPAGMLKTDKRDALGLANHLYNQLEKGVQLADKTHLVRRLLAPTESAQQLKRWMHHRSELSQECARRKNKLIAICDELFPEFVQIFHDPNLPMALAIREHFPTPHAIATAPLTALAALRTRSRPSNAQLVHLQQLACESIGTKDLIRQRSLVLEQGQLIKEMKLLVEHMQQLDAEIRKIVEQSREGKILTSMGLGLIQTASILSAIGNILNFEHASDLKAYFGWAPKVDQSGTTLDRARLMQGGKRAIKQTMYLVVCRLIQQRDTEWAKLYERLVPRKCAYDERRQAYRGRGKVIGRVAGQMIEMLYALLKQDAEVLSQVAPGETPPDPILYDPEIHRRHRSGEYRPLKNAPRQRKVIRLPERTS
jgi:transposase